MRQCACCRSTEKGKGFDLTGCGSAIGAKFSGDGGVCRGGRWWRLGLLLLRVRLLLLLLLLLWVCRNVCRNVCYVCYRLLLLLLLKSHNRHDRLPLALCALDAAVDHAHEAEHTSANECVEEPPLQFGGEQSIKQQPHVRRSSTVVVQQGCWNDHNDSPITSSCVSTVKVRNHWRPPFPSRKGNPVLRREMALPRRDRHAHYVTSTSQAEYISARYTNTDHFQTNYSVPLYGPRGSPSRSPRQVSTQVRLSSAMHQMQGYTSMCTAGCLGIMITSTELDRSPQKPPFGFASVPMAAPQGRTPSRAAIDEAQRQRARRCLVLITSAETHAQQRRKQMRGAVSQTHSHCDSGFGWARLACRGNALPHNALRVHNAFAIGLAVVVAACSAGGDARGQSKRA